MSKKKILLTVLAVVLISAISVAGTLAYLTASSNLVTNTFVAAPDLGALELKEHKVTENKDGSYTKGTEEVESNTYKVAPGVELPKDPFVRITEKSATPAYVYIEVVDGIPTMTENGQIIKTVTYQIESIWLKLDDVKGENGGQIYVLTSDGINPLIVDEETALTNKVDGEDVPVDYNILVGKTVSTNPNATFSGEFTLKFFAYMAQASAGTNATEVFNNCF